ncbi:hypothetical protein BDB01DRAFT_847329 [Pilobolus umbonatus]|nr:hypothetical protein BDB01DRAFT_847329 [Pilobolus umbonatus]
MFLSAKERASRSLRRLTKSKISTPLPQFTTLELPKKIIKALYDYKRKRPAELNFNKGDFFHVTGRENDMEWFEACNPATNIKGLVPVSYFQIIERTERSIQVSRPNSCSTTSTSTSDVDSGFSDMSIHAQNRKKSQQIYGIVLYDFIAERSDELDAYADEPIVIIAQSSHEWFVAKPISRLGGPGLIPISFVEIRDVQTGQIIDHTKDSSVQLIPAVEDWKKMTQSYEASSIALGVFDKKNRISDLSTESMPVIDKQVIYASIDSYLYEGGQYWFVVYARLNQGSHRILYRLYEDFYEFQISFLQTFPVEAGRSDKERILPFMPGPLTIVDEKITAERQADLDLYCKDLLVLPSYIAECELVQIMLFGIHEGDIELDYDPRNSNPMVRQSTLNSSHSKSALSQPLEHQQIKVKIIHRDDIFAMKVPVDCTLEHLRSKIYDRIGYPVNMEYKNEAKGTDEPLNSEIDMEEAFVQAIQRGKLTMTVTPINK